MQRFDLLLVAHGAHRRGSVCVIYASRERVHSIPVGEIATGPVYYAFGVPFKFSKNEDGVVVVWRAGEAEKETRAVCIAS